MLSGVAEYTTALAADYARDAEKAGIDGLMLLPAMVYKSNRRETLHHYRTVAQATGLPIMVYNNPVSYGVDITVDMFGELADLPNIVAIKESSEDTRRLTDLQRAHGDRFVLFAGVDDIVLECLMLGASGWVSGLTNAFPRESVALFALAKAGRYAEALAIYRWFMPLLHLDTIPTLVQCIKLAEQLMGRGSEMVRAPRLCLDGRGARLGRGPGARCSRDTAEAVMSLAAKVLLGALCALAVIYVWRWIALERGRTREAAPALPRAAPCAHRASSPISSTPSASAPSRPPPRCSNYCGSCPTNVFPAR